MAKHKRIQPSTLPRKGKIPVPSVPSPPSEIVFSFKYLQLQHPKFDTIGKDSEYFHQLLDRLKNLCTWQKQELLSDRSKSLRCHPIYWEKTTEKSGFSGLNQQLREIQPYQISISRDVHGRIHGFFIADIFYIVWLDPSHNLYS